MGARYESDAEFDIHVDKARRAGVGWDVIRSIPGGMLLRGNKVAIVLFASELLDKNTVCHEMYDATRDRLHGCDLAMVKIVVIVGYYAFVSYTLNAFRIPLLVERSGG